MKKLLYILAFYFFTTSFSNALIKVDITRGNLDPLPIAVSPLPVDNNSDDDYMIKPGERLFQVIHPLLIPFTTKIVDRLSKSERGEGGFGSTGK